MCQSRVAQRTGVGIQAFLAHTKYTNDNTEKNIGKQRNGLSGFCFELIQLLYFTYVYER